MVFSDFNLFAVKDVVSLGNLKNFSKFAIESIFIEGVLNLTEFKAVGFFDNLRFYVVDVLGNNLCCWVTVIRSTRVTVALAGSDEVVERFTVGFELNNLIRISMREHWNFSIIVRAVKAVVLAVVTINLSITNLRASRLFNNVAHAIVIIEYFYRNNVTTLLTVEISGLSFAARERCTCKKVKVVMLGKSAFKVDSSVPIRNDYTVGLIAVNVIILVSLTVKLMTGSLNLHIVDLDGSVCVRKVLSALRA